MKRVGRADKARGEEEGRKRRESRGEVEERREWKECRSTMRDKNSNVVH